jgi:hypothetical protein
MTRIRAIPLVAAAALVGLSACTKDGTSPSALISDPQVTADVAAAAGDAIATDVATLIGNESAGALPVADASFDLFGATADTIITNRTKTCYDGSDVVVANCLPMASVRKIVFLVRLDGVHNGTLVRTAVHRARDWTLTRLFTNTTETARQHDGVGLANDTTVFDNPTTQVTRTHRLTALDSTIAVVFNLPRATNPWPVSGMMVRRVAVHTTFASPTKQETRDYAKRIEVDFPADAQGNVVLKIDSKTCSLNLVTHSVTNCQ